MALIKRIVVAMLMLALPLAAWGAEREKRTKALSEGEIVLLIQTQIDDEPIIGPIDRLWIDFEPTAEVLERLKKAGASDEVLARLRKGKVQKIAQSDLPDDPRRESIAIWVSRSYSWENPLHSEVRVNSKLINEFSSEGQEPIGKHLKMGWNTITVKTAVKGPEKNSNSLRFSIGTTRKKADSVELEMDRVLWKFDNGSDWSHKDNKMVHKLGPKTREVTHTYRLFFAGLKHESQTIEDGDYVLQAHQSYHWLPPVVGTIFVNDTPFTTFLGESRPHVVVTDQLKKGRNVIKLVGTRVSNVLGGNDFKFSLGGSAEWSAQQDQFLLRPMKEFTVMGGWAQDKKTGQWLNEEKPDSDTYERTIEVILNEDPKAKKKQPK